MANIETLQASFDRFEREQKVRDQGLLRAFAMFATELKRLQEMLADHEQEQRLPMDMGDFMRLMTMMLDRQQQLLEAIGERVETETGMDEPPPRGK